MSDPDPQFVGAAETRTRIDTSKPHSARFWNFSVDSKDSYQVDRELGVSAYGRVGRKPQ